MFFFYQKTMTGRWSARREAYRPDVKGPEGMRRLPFEKVVELPIEDHKLPLTELEKKYPRVVLKSFDVDVSETCFYRGIVKAESEEALRNMRTSEMDLVEYDSEEMDFISIEEIEPNES